MKLRVDNWPRLLAMGAIVAVTTGLAAAPLRKAVAPLLGDSLGSWSLPTRASQAAKTAEVAGRAPSESSRVTGSSAAGAGSTATVGEDFILARNEVGPLDFAALAAEHGRVAALAASRDGDSWRQQGRGWKFGASRSFGGGRWGNIPGGGVATARVGGQGAAAGVGNARRANDGDRASRGGDGASGARPDNGRRPDNGGRDEPIFNEHHSGFPELTGRQDHNVPGGGGGINAPTLASNPEPSTLILFGTGLATAVGAIRRRLRRR